MKIRFLVLGGFAVVLAILASCGDDSDADPVSTFSCDVNNGSGLDYCQDYQVTESTKASFEASCSTAQGIFSDSGLCVVAVGTQGCVVTDLESGQSSTIWLDGASWTDETIASNAICEDGVLTTKT